MQLRDSTDSLIVEKRQKITISATISWQKLVSELTIEKDGNLTVFIDNQDTEPVYFDELELRVESDPTLVITQEHHYYPFGMNLSGIERQGDLMYQFNGMVEKEEAFGLELYETPFRSYDAQLGRFWQVEPLADIYCGISMYQYAYNNPVSFNDPNGLSAVGDLWRSVRLAVKTTFARLGGNYGHVSINTNSGRWTSGTAGGRGGSSGGASGGGSMGGSGWLSGNRGFASMPTGSPRNRGIDMSDLRAGDPAGATRLVKDLKRFTGLGSLHINKNGFLDYNRSYWIGKVFGFNKIKNPSAIARRELIRAINSRTVTQVLNNYNGAHGKTASDPIDTGIGNKGDPNGNTILFDRWQIENIQLGASYGLRKAGLQRTWGLATNFLHEYKHTLKGGQLLDNHTESYPLGDTESWVNRIRSQMNLPLMQQYAQERYEEIINDEPYESAFGVMFFEQAGLKYFKSNYKLNENHLYMRFSSSFVGM
ncbi:RHS repeat domain-containing protein [Bernardetia litoralis]|uniref:RHS repeat domain-containing protein n=1 Tax=Bernardetia litoralis TaxID=999 RepID=UPI0002E60773|nr:RHS repeat-associated core domain-containing protein [Bernardetia litoralis]